MRPADPVLRYQLSIDGLAIPNIGALFQAAFTKYFGLVVPMVVFAQVLMIFEEVSNP
jgi:hypothetical protein